MKLILMCLWGLVCITSIGYADVVTLKNGDRVTGTMVVIKAGNLQLKSDILGSLSIPLDKIATFSAAKPVAVVVKDQNPVEGTLELKPSGDWQVTANGKAQTIPAANAQVIMAVEAYHTLVEASPEPWQAWKGNATLGYAIQHGNQETNTLTTTIDAVRERPEAPIFQSHWRTNYGFTALLSHAEEDSSTVTSRTITTNLRQDYLFSPSNFVFGIGQFDHISTEGLYLRQTFGGGFGHDVIKTSHTTFSLLGGMTFVHEKFFVGVHDQSADALVGEKLGRQLSKWVRLDHSLNFYPNLTNGGQYRFDTTTILSVKLTNKFSLNTSVIDLYLSNPPTGNEKNNITISTGIGYAF